MPPTEAITAFANRNPRLARAAGWALLGAAAILIVPDLHSWLNSQGLYVEWEVGPVYLSSSNLLFGLVYSGTLAVALWRAGHAGWWRAAGFALVSMFWLDFGLSVGMRYWTFINSSPLDGIMMFATGFLTAGLWMTLASLLFLPSLRRREDAVRTLAAVYRLLAVGVAGGALAGVVASVIVEILVSGGEWQYLGLSIAIWGAVYAAALSWALPPTRRVSGAG